MVMLRPLLGYSCWNYINSALSEFWVQVLSLGSPIFGNSRDTFFFDGDATTVVQVLFPKSTDVYDLYLQEVN
jgi:hypothetical protein